MKSSNRRLIPLLAAVILIICVYQAYWLMGQYRELRDRMEKDLQEVLRSSDFEELVHRVDLISKMEYQGRISVHMGYDHQEKQSVVKSETSSDPSPEFTEGSQLNVSPSSFSSILKNPEDLMNIGLNMQRGIHSSLDRIMEVDLDFMDDAIASKLDTLGVDISHQLVYVRDGIKKMASESRIPAESRIKDSNLQFTDTFRLAISPDTEYMMIIPHWNMAVIKKMAPMILFSLVTLLLLAGAFWYLVRVMNRQRELEEIKTDFTNNITHELKTPIAVAYAANDALLNFDSSGNTPRMNRYLTVCQDQLRLLDRLVEQILSLSMERRQSFILNVKPIDVRELLESLIDTFKMKYPDKAVFHLSVPKGLTIHSDSMHLSNIIGNLIDNAVKYSRQEAEVTVAARLDDDGKILIEVADNGIGMTSEQQKLVFDKFYRVPHGNIHNVKGYGLGLFYVKTMTEKLGGSVRLESEPGKGSIFYLTFKNDTPEL